MDETFVLLHQIVRRLRGKMEERGQFQEDVICIQLADSCKLPKAPWTSACTCERLDNGRYFSEDLEDMDRGYGFVNGHALFNGEFRDYQKCLASNLKAAIAADLESAYNASTLAQWLAEALVMRLVLLSMESQDKFTVFDRTYAMDDEPRHFQTCIMFDVCQV